MIKSELVRAVAAKNPHLSQVKIDHVVTVIFDAISKRLAAGGRVELRGFGAFSTRTRTAYTGRNPRTGDQVELTAKRVPHFTAGKSWHARLNR